MYPSSIDGSYNVKQLNNFYIYFTPPSPDTDYRHSLFLHSILFSNYLKLLLF